MGSLWRRIELILLLTYAAVFYVIVIHRSVKISTEFSVGSKAGSLWGLKQEMYWARFNDISDNQWRNFRGNLPMLTTAMAIFTLINFIGRSLSHLSGKGMIRLWLLMSLAYILYLHGTCTVFIFVMAGCNYLLVKVLAGSPLLPIILWLYNLVLLISNRVYEGYLFSSFGESVAFLDNYRGVLRWHIGFNFVMLRMVSFGIDYHWTILSHTSAIDWEKHNQTCNFCHNGISCYLSRQEKFLAVRDYSFDVYLCYLMYPPLYIAGPIISFNAFASQFDSPQKCYDRLAISCYGFRWLACLGLMEVLTHMCYYNSFAVSGVWQMLSPWENFVIGYGVLNFMWLKFLLIWRFFRFWALVGGIETVENMPRCVNNCYDLEGFWKSWHASYNRWLVRYVYIPLGGAQWRVLNIWAIFSFVALWHDLEWKLLSWAWVTCLLMIPEVSIKSLMHTAKMQKFRRSHLCDELCAVLGALNISGLMAANLLGFVLGPQGMRWLVTRMFEKQNISVIIGILCSFYVGTKLMFRIRENEVQQKTNKLAE
eukprot:c22868_g1_i1 orf=188-1798(+)